jgi:hypothetical protein
MGKSWKEKPGKYRNNRDFQKKQKNKNKKHSFEKVEDEYVFPWYGDKEGP